MSILENLRNHGMNLRPDSAAEIDHNLEAIEVPINQDGLYSPPEGDDWYLGFINNEDQVALFLRKVNEK